MKLKKGKRFKIDGKLYEVSQCNKLPGNREHALLVEVENEKKTIKE